MKLRKLLFASVFTVFAGVVSAHKTTPEWLNNAVFYDIYPCSFMDSDGNGVGDLPGITSKLDYVKSLGVDAIWMTPIFESGWFDGGYDIKDYYKIDPRFGQKSDFVNLVNEAHKRGLKVCLDLVPGHSSDQHEWFKRSCTEGPEGRYADYYIFADSISEKDLADIQLRNQSEDPQASKIGNWVLTEDAHPGVPVNGKYKGKYYYKNHFACQPALNFGYANPDPSKPWQQSVDAPGPKALRRELKNIMAYWFDLGVDGFRVDMAASLVKNDIDKKETGRLWDDMREWVDREYPGKVLISEWGKPSLSCPAGFDCDFLIVSKNPGMQQLVLGSKNEKIVGKDAYFEKTGIGGIDKFVKEFSDYYNASKDYGYISLFSASHDVNRLNSEGRDTPDQIKTFMTWLFTMPGVPFIHYGDEIMMRNIKGLPSVEGSMEVRSGTRTPMQWDNSENAGFSTAEAEKLFLPVFTFDGKYTVETQESDPNSVLNFVRAVNKIRHEHPTLANQGDWVTINDISKPYPWIYTRTGEDGTYVIVLNPGEKRVEATVDLPSGNLDCLISNGKITAKSTGKGTKFSVSGCSSAIYKLLPTAH